MHSKGNVRNVPQHAKHVNQKAKHRDERYGLGSTGTGGGCCCKMGKSLSRAAGGGLNGMISGRSGLAGFGGIAGFLAEFGASVAFTVVKGGTLFCSSSVSSIWSRRSCGSFITELIRFILGRCWAAPDVKSISEPNLQHATATFICVRSIG